MVCRSANDSARYWRPPVSLCCRHARQIRQCQICFQLIDDAACVVADSPPAAERSTVASPALICSGPWPRTSQASFSVSGSSGSEISLICRALPPCRQSARRLKKEKHSTLCGWRGHPAPDCRAPTESKNAAFNLQPLCRHQISHRWYELHNSAGAVSVACERTSPDQSRAKSGAVEKRKFLPRSAPGSRSSLAGSLRGVCSPLRLITTSSESRGPVMSASAQ